mmetsp:Transcript_13574/g.57063  ORF Transcript_13574/g.57063 Transcript_13574/m.57063 type:complete len:309 (+) Transcript_13574:686-1612(+)
MRNRRRRRRAHSRRALRAKKRLRRLCGRKETLETHAFNRARCAGGDPRARPGVGHLEHHTRRRVARAGRRPRGARFEERIARRERRRVGGAGRVGHSVRGRAFRLDARCFLLRQQRDDPGRVQNQGQGRRAPREGEGGRREELDSGARQRFGAHVPRHGLRVRHGRAGTPARRDQRVRDAARGGVHRVLRLLRGGYMGQRAGRPLSDPAAAHHQSKHRRETGHQRGRHASRFGRVGRGGSRGRSGVLPRGFDRAAGHGKVRARASLRDAVARARHRRRRRNRRVARGLCFGRDGAVLRVLLHARAHGE